MGTSNLKVYLAKKDITLKELSFMTGIHQGTLSRVANGRTPHISTALAISDALGIHITKLWSNFEYAQIKRSRTS